MSEKKFSLFVFLVAVFLAFGFQGSRGIWEPDEGFYISAARSMVSTGDWVVPQFYLRPFLDKPPLVYWGSALAMDLFGIHQWSARLAHAVWFLMTVLVVGLFGTSIWDRRTGQLAALVYATTPVPLIAGNIVTPDTPLAFWVSCGLYCFWRSARLEKVRGAWVWRIGAGISFGFAVLSKGPAAIVFLAPMVAFLLSERRFLSTLFSWSGLVSLSLFLVIGGSWYVAILWMIPGAFEYIVDNQITGRLFTEKYNRNPQFYAPFFVYAPIVISGTLPWSLAWYPNIGRLWKRSTWRKFPTWSQTDRRVRFLMLWFVTPLLIFSMASSRLPLYILPLFVPLSLLSARCWWVWKPSWFSFPLSYRRVGLLLLWAGLLLATKWSLAWWPTPRDTRSVWEGIKGKVPQDGCEIVVVNSRLHGLSFYSGGDVEWVSTKASPYPFFFGPDRLEEELHEHSISHRRHAYLTPTRHYATVRGALLERGISFVEESGPYDFHLLVCEVKPRKERAVRLAAMGDTRSGSSMQVQLGSALYHIDREAPFNGILLLGDNFSFLGDPSDYEENFAKPYAALVNSGIRFFAVLGNHDVGPFARFQMMHPLFNMKGQRFHDQVFGENLVHCFFLDSNTLPNDDVQLAWFRERLRWSKAPWKVVAMHYPLYGVTKRRPEPIPELRETLEPLFHEGGVSIVLSGHNHVYQRLRPINGVHYFTAGSGGRVDHGILLENDPDMLAGNDETTIALCLRFTEAECEFKAINSLEQTVDSGAIERERQEKRQETP